MSEAPETIDGGLNDGTYKILHNSGFSGGLDEQGEFLTIPYLIPYKFRRDFMTSLLSESKALGDEGEVSFWQIAAPHQCPVSGFEFLRAFTFTWDVWGTLKLTDNGGEFPIDYSDMIIKVMYRVPFFGDGLQQIQRQAQSITKDPREQERLIWTTQNIDHRTEMITIRDGEWIIDEGPHTGEVVSNAPTARSVRINDISITFHRVPFFPEVLLDSTLKNPCNIDTFLGLSPETVKFNGASTSFKSWVGGFVTREVTLNFSHRPEAPWTHAYTKFGWLPISNSDSEDDADSLLCYPVDFSILLNMV